MTYLVDTSITLRTRVLERPNAVDGYMEDAIGAAHGNMCTSLRAATDTV